MSRRTKLIILTLCFVLSTIFVVCAVVVNRGPENPLRFHIVWDPTTPEAYTPDGQADELHMMVVENVSASPVLFQEVRFMLSESPSNIQGFRRAYTFGNRGESPNYQLISPGSPVLIPLDEHQYVNCVFGGHEIAYYVWTTSPRLTARRSMKDLWDALPYSLGKFLPSFMPNLDTAPVTIMTKKEADKLMPQPPENTSP